eukprot:gene25160-biopygen4483
MLNSLRDRSRADVQDRTHIFCCPLFGWDSWVVIPRTNYWVRQSSRFIALRKPYSIQSIPVHSKENNSSNSIVSHRAICAWIVSSGEAGGPHARGAVVALSVCGSRGFRSGAIPAAPGTMTWCRLRADGEVDQKVVVCKYTRGATNSRKS